RATCATSCAAAALAAITQYTANSAAVGCTNRVKKYARTDTVPIAVARGPNRLTHTAAPVSMTNTTIAAGRHEISAATDTARSTAGMRRPAVTMRLRAVGPVTTMPACTDRNTPVARSAVSACTTWMTPDVNSALASTPADIAIADFSLARPGSRALSACHRRAGTPITLSFISEGVEAASA